MGPSLEIPGKCSGVREGRGTNWWGRGRTQGPGETGVTDSWVLKEERTLRAAQRWASTGTYGNAECG